MQRFILVFYILFDLAPSKNNDVMLSHAFRSLRLPSVDLSIAAA
jgi:hypothetical protein